MNTWKNAQDQIYQIHYGINLIQLVTQPTKRILIIMSTPMYCCFMPLHAQLAGTLYRMCSNTPLMPIPHVQGQLKSS